MTEFKLGPIVWDGSAAIDKAEQKRLRKASKSLQEQFR